MGTIIVKPKLDIDAKNYIDAVQNADQAFLEPNVRQAINRFVKGCKDDGIWNAIKASCILAGARTLNGALVPLKGSAPTNFNFVTADYNRKTGLKGGGVTKYLDSNRASNADPQNNHHLCVYKTEHGGGTQVYIGVLSNNAGASHIVSSVTSQTTQARSRSVTARGTSINTTLGTIAVSRSISTEFSLRASGVTEAFAANSDGVSTGNSFVFGSNSSGLFLASASRLSFYSIGESLELTLLDTRISTLMTTLDSVIP